MHKRHLVGDERPRQRKFRRIQNLLDVDAAGIDGRKKRLPGEVLATTSWLGQEVSRGHSTCDKRGAKEMHRSHKQGRTERKEVFNEYRNA
ncbi:hypothetical protein FLBR109950_13730 [Flavobacterium branchiophilum]